MPQAGDRYTWTGTDESGGPVNQEMEWNANMLSTNPDTGELIQGGWVPYVAPYSQTTNQDTGQISYYLPGQGYTAPAQMSAAQLTPDVVYGQYGGIGEKLQGALNAFAQSSGADPNTLLQAANAYANTYGISSTENPYDLAKKIISGTDFGAANQYKEPFISAMFADPGVQAVGQQVQQAWQAQNQPDTWIGGAKNVAADVGSFLSGLSQMPGLSAALPVVLPVAATAANVLGGQQDIGSGLTNIALTYAAPEATKTLTEAGVPTPIASALVNAAKQEITTGNIDPSQLAISTLGYLAKEAQKNQQASQQRLSSADKTFLDQEGLGYTPTPIDWSKGTQFASALGRTDVPIGRYILVTPQDGTEDLAQESESFFSKIGSILGLGTPDPNAIKQGLFGGASGGDDDAFRLVTWDQRQQAQELIISRLNNVEDPEVRRETTRMLERSLSPEQKVAVSELIDSGSSKEDAIKIVTGADPSTPMDLGGDGALPIDAGGAGAGGALRGGGAGGALRGGGAGGALQGGDGGALPGGGGIPEQPSVPIVSPPPVVPVNAPDYPLETQPTGLPTTASQTGLPSVSAPSGGASSSRGAGSPLAYVYSAPAGPLPSENLKKPFLQGSMISTGSPKEIALYKGLINLLSKRGYADGGLATDQYGLYDGLINLLASRGYAIGGEVMVPGPEGKMYQWQPQRGFAVGGPGTGQSDDIPTMLSDGEYVIDADTVAALGDGSSKAGAAVLDKMREQIRRHKRSAPADKIPPKAKSPLEYIRMAKKHG